MQVAVFLKAGKNTMTNAANEKAGQANVAIVDSYIGVDDPVRIYDLVKQGLKKNLQLSEDKAERYAWFTQATYKELMDQYGVVDGLKRIAKVTNATTFGIQVGRKLHRNYAELRLCLASGKLVKFRYCQVLLAGPLFGYGFSM
jgi:hypothetical protein